MSTLLWHFAGRAQGELVCATRPTRSPGALQLSLLREGKERLTTWEADCFMGSIGNHCAKLINSFKQFYLAAEVAPYESAAVSVCTMKCSHMQESQISPCLSLLQPEIGALWGK